MDELVAAAAAVAMVDGGYAVNDVGQSGAQSACAATEVAGAAVDVMDMDKENRQGCAAAEGPEDADPKVSNATRVVSTLRKTPPNTLNGCHALRALNPCCAGCGGPARPEAR